MDIERRLRTQWTEAAQDWIETDQAVRTGMLDSWMLDALGDVSGKTVIDIGCGEGRFCRLLAELGAVVTGVDLTEPLIERARSLGSDRETYTVGDAEDLDGVCDGSFDLAVSYIVLVDLLDYQRSIREAYRVLRPGGRFVVCSVHPMRSAVISSEGLDQRRRPEAVLPAGQLHGGRPPRVQLVGPIIRQHAPDGVRLRFCLPGRRIRPGGAS